MANMHWFVRLVIVAIVGAIDYEQGQALIGFALAAFYLAATLWSLIRRDKVMLKKRAFVLALLVIEVLTVASITETPVDLNFLQRWIDEQAGHEYYKTK